MKIYNHFKRTSEMSATPDKYPQGRFNIKLCKWCSADFLPVAPSHLFCSDSCRDDNHTNTYYVKKYGVGIKYVRELFEKQGGVCAICKKTGFKMLDTHMSGVNLDHDHKTGRVRGLLCHNCNRGLGLFQDNPDILLAAREYLSGNEL